MPSSSVNPSESTPSVIPSQATQDFILRHLHDDVKSLALKAPRDGDVDIACALQQIAGYQMAAKKLPAWAATDGIIYPPHLALEQCSSEQTARYKAAVAGRFDLHSLVDLTGGMGVDFACLAQGMDEAVYVERQEELCRIAEHNFACLHLKARVVTSDSTRYLQESGPADLLFIDPARRDRNGGRTFAISDCTPDVIALQDELLSKAKIVLVKLSPMLDWRKAAADLGEAVREVHIVAGGDECKELLLLLRGRVGEMEEIPRRVACYCDGQCVSFAVDEHWQASAPAAAETADKHTEEEASPDQPPFILIEPHAALMKAGFFRQMERRYGVRQLAPNSHLMLKGIAEDRPLPSFIADSPLPGRHFRIDTVCSMNKKELKDALRGISQANITVRNFPLTAEQLRKKLKLADGGDRYIFASTLEDGQHRLFVGGK